MTAKLSSSLTRERLAEGALADSAEMAAHGLKEHGGFLLFGLERRPRFFHRDIGVDLSTGEIHLGGVQREVPPVVRFAGAWSGGVARATIESYDGGFVGVPVLFELERLFAGDLGRFELTHMFADGKPMAELVTERERRTFEAWHQKYQGAVRDSLMGRPVLEADFAHRTALGRGRRFDLRKLYGKRVLAQLQGLSRFDLSDKYLS